MGKIVFEEIRKNLKSVAFIGLVFTLQACVNKADVPATETTQPSTTTPVTTTPTTPVVTPPNYDSSGCGVSSPTGTLTAVSITVAGYNRTFDVIIPANYNRNESIPMVFLFHGSGGSTYNNKEFADAVKDTNNGKAISVYPQGIPYAGYHNYVGWNQNCSGYDMPFVDAMYEYVTTRYCVNKNKVFASGFSWGSDMSFEVACCRGDKFRGIAPFGGLDVKPAQYPSQCTAQSKYPAVRLQYGTADGSISQQQINFLTNYGKTALNCTNDTESLSPAPCTGYKGCDRPWISCPITGGGHDAPTYNDFIEAWKWMRSFQ